MVTTASLGCAHLVATYRSGWRLGPIDVDLGPGIHALVGPNGAGKSTLLQVLAGMRRAQDGDVLWNGEPLRSTREWDRFRDALAVVPQDAAWPGSWRAAEFLRLQGRVHGVPSTELTEAVDAAARSCGASDLLDRRMGALSGGQRQRVFLAGALVHDPSVLVLDEPTVGLDPGERAAFRRHVSSVARQEQRIVVLSTHLMDDVALMADEVHVLRSGEVVWQGTVTELEEAGTAHDGTAHDRDGLTSTERGYLALTEEQE